MAKGAPDTGERLIPEPPRPGVILTDVQIQELVTTRQLIAPATFEARGLDACSYDVRVGRKGIIGGHGVELDLMKLPLEVGPGGYAAVISEEKVKIPDNMVVRLNSERSFSYEGIALLTGTQIDPGYEGHLLFAFYNASSRRVILRRGRAICSLVFETLESSVSRPKPPDPDLLYGNFPDRFVNDMANMEVLSWSQLSEHVKEIDKIAKDILDLRAKYENVLEPIKVLTGNVDRLSQDVDKLSVSLREVGKDVANLQKITSENAQLITSLGTSVHLLVSEVGGLKKDTEKHGDRIVDLSTRFGRFSLVVYIFWAILLIFLGTVIKDYVYPKIFPVQQGHSVPADGPSSGG
jgi:deoxycytidine triphosphate deaminase